MSSGFGARGGVGRCYKYFEDYVICIKTQSAAAGQLQPCFDFRDDYFECLHHKKEEARKREITAELERRNENPTASHPSH